MWNMKLLASVSRILNTLPMGKCIHTHIQKDIYIHIDIKYRFDILKLIAIGFRSFSFVIGSSVYSFKTLSRFCLNCLPLLQ